MKRVNLFLILLITAITALIAATVIGFAIFSTNQQNPYSWMSQMWGSSNGYGGMGGMMNQTPTPTTTASSMLPYYGVLFAVLIAVTIVGVIGVAYYLVYPQIRMGTHSTTNHFNYAAKREYSLRLRISLQNPNRRRTQNHHRPTSPRRQIPAEIHQKRNRPKPTANPPNHRQTHPNAASST